MRPERIYVWPDGDVDSEPQLFDSHMEEVRSGHVEEPEGEHAPPEGGGLAWDERMEELGARYRDAVVSLVAPDGFPFSVRLPIELDRAARRVRLGGAPVGVPWQPGLACLTAHDHDPDFKWQRNFQVRGDLVEEDGCLGADPAQARGRLRAAARLAAGQRCGSTRRRCAATARERQARAGRARRALENK